MRFVRLVPGLTVMVVASASGQEIAPPNRLAAKLNTLKAKADEAKRIYERILTPLIDGSLVRFQVSEPHVALEGERAEISVEVRIFPDTAGLVEVQRQLVEHSKRTAERHERVSDCASPRPDTNAPGLKLSIEGLTWIFPKVSVAPDATTIPVVVPSFTGDRAGMPRGFCDVFHVNRNHVPPGLVERPPSGYLSRSGVRNDAAQIVVRSKDSDGGIIAEQVLPLRGIRLGLGGQWATNWDRHSVLLVAPGWAINGVAPPDRVVVAETLETRITFRVSLEDAHRVANIEAVLLRPWPSLTRGPVNLKNLRSKPKLKRPSGAPRRSARRFSRRTWITS